MITGEYQFGIVQSYVPGASALVGQTRARGKLAPQMYVLKLPGDTLAWSEITSIPTSVFQTSENNQMGEFPLMKGRTAQPAH